MEYYSAIKRNKIGALVVMWMNLESVIQSEVRKRNMCTIYQYIYMESKEMVLVNLLAGQEADVENKLVDTGRRKRWDRLREWH